ncbi:MAG: antibiotic biosynthesis monooxygenase [Pseudomonadota bacterium]
MIIRIWQGWTKPENADAYEKLLKTRIWPEIRAKGIPGLLRIELFRLETPNETEFMTLFRFDNMDSVRLMTGGAAETAYVPECARLVLSRFDHTARHFQTTG